MKRSILYSCLIISAFLAGCNKLELEPVGNDPVFKSTLQLDGTPLEWQAGVNDYYMYAQHDYDALGVHVFSGRFAKTGIANGEELAFFIRGHEVSDVEFANVEASLSPNRDFTFYNVNASDTTWVPIVNTDYRVVFDRSNSIFPNGTSPSFLWDFGDNTTSNSNAAIVTHVYDTLTSATYASLDISLASIGSHSSLAQQIANISDPSLPTFRLIDLTVDIDSAAGEANISALVAGGAPPYQYDWNNGFSNDTFIVLNTTSGAISASLEVTDANGTTINASIDSISVTPSGTSQFCASIFEHTLEIIQDTVGFTPVITPNDSFQLSKITVEYVNSDGLIYRSDRHAQTPTAYFRIIEIAEYERNENNEKTKQLKIEYACRLWNEFGDYMDVTNGQGVIAVSYP